MRFRVMAAFLAASVLSGAAADAAIVEDFKAADWDGSAYTSDETGRFTHCAVYASYQNGSTLYFSYEAAESWYLSVTNDSWALTEGAEYAVKFKVDRSGEIAGTGVALANNQIGLPIETDHPFVGQLQRGDQLTITFQDQGYGFDLSNLNQAMDAAQACVRRHVAAGTHSPVMSRGSEEQAAPPEQSATQEPASEDPVSKESTGTKVGEASSADEDTTEQTTRSGDMTETRAELPALGTTLLEEINVPGWKAAAFSLDDGSFTHCVIKAEYQNGATLGVARTTDGDYVLAIQHGDWTLEPAIWVPISYSVKGGNSLSAAQEGQAAEANLILAVMGGEELTDTLKAATEMTIDAEGKSFSFDVSDIGPGIEAIDKCVVRHTSLAEAPPSESAPHEHAPAPAAKKADAAAESEEVSEPKTDVASSGTEGEGPTESEGPGDNNEVLPSGGEEVASADPVTAGMDVHTEAAGFTTALLFRSGYPNHVILGADATVPSELPPGDAMWQLDDVTGSTRIESGAGTPDDIERSIRQGLLEKCGGAVKQRIISSDATQMHFAETCGADAGTVMQFVVLPRNGGGSYVFALIGKPGNGLGVSIAEALYAAAIGG